MAAEAAPLNLRVYGLEGRVNDLDAAYDRERQRGDRHDESIGKQAQTLAVHDAAIASQHESINKLSSAVWWLVGALLTFSLTVAGSAAVVVLTHS